METIIVVFLLFSLFYAPTFGAKQSYIVYMGAHSHGPDASTEDFVKATNDHYNFLASFMESHEVAKNAIHESYTKHINGFAATLEEDQAAEIAKHPDVVSVFPDRGKTLHTTRSWDFMLLENNGVISSSSLWSQAKLGEDIIIANLDTGVWPEAKSFSDEGFGPIPTKWKGHCEKSSDGLFCNRKLIGARHFSKGYKAAGGKLNKTIDSGRDVDGHGTHTLSTAGGNFVQGANIFGVANGTVKGGSPRARVASYKVCWTPLDGDSCFDSDILAAFDTAIHDGVDVLSISLGGDVGDYFDDGLAIGAFHAVQKGIIVVCSAGNSGPEPGTVSNVAPWMITVGASTMDRKIQSAVELRNGRTLQGASLSTSLPEAKLYPLISAAEAKLANVSSKDALLCKPNTLDHEKVKGKIIACLRGDTARVDKGMQAKLAGAVGMILCNDKIDGDDIEADFHFLPATNINYEDGSTLFAYINSTNEPMAYITAPTVKLGIKPAPMMASFSSRGPNKLNPELLKPDITAPGVNVMAAYSEVVSPTSEPYDNRKVSFMFESGTSMSCPHISGVAGLLRTLYPKWSPAAIRSAIMTTARTRDNTISPMKEGLKGTKATPFGYGAGHVRPNRAMDPGLVYDLTNSDYFDFLCGLGYNKTMINLFDSHNCSSRNTSSDTLLNFNYPSITIPKLSGTVTVSRTVTNVGSPGVYVSRVRRLEGVEVTVKPEMLKFKHVGEKKSFKVTFTSTGNLRDYEFGELTWSDGNHYVRSPIVVSSAAKQF